MNGLTLRISGTNSKKMKGSISFNPVTIPQYYIDKIGVDGTLYEKFCKCHSVDEQLAILKNIQNDCKEGHALRFLVIIFLQAEVKHPVKCFLVRYITKNSHLQEPFSKALAQEISVHITTNNIDYNKFKDFVPKLVSCIENFPAGALAVKQVEIGLAEYLSQSLQRCVEILRCTKSLSPTEKNEIFNLSHLTLRLLLYVVQKWNYGNTDDLIPFFILIRFNIKELLFDDDVPMDTKSVCSILLISMHVLEFGSDSWIEILITKDGRWDYSGFIENESAKLSLYSALVTVVPTHEVCSKSIGDDPALVTLTHKVLTIGEKNSSDSAVTLGVTRTLVQISKTLAKTSDRTLGLKLVDSLLTFVWSHLEHYMDSVRHLTAQALVNIVRYCTGLKKKGDDKALDNLFTALTSLDRSRKSYYVSITSLTSEMGASCILESVPNVIGDLIRALDIQPVQASATTALETLLQRYSKESSSKVLYDSWVKPILSHVTANDLESTVLNILENLLLQAVRLDEDVMNYLLPYIKQLTNSNKHACDDLKCVLMLLSVARKSNVGGKLKQCEEEWKGLISYDVLKMAAVDAVDEIRILTLSLIVESPKTTEAFTDQELNLVLVYLTYNINAQAPNFRQLTLSMMKKFMKRLDDSYKVIKRLKLPNDECYKYLTFLEKLREQCYKCLMPGVNYSRRHVALQVLVWCERTSFEGYQRTWKVEYVDNLLMHLEDSYETNKAFALDVLTTCPVELIKSQKHTVGLELEDILRQASSVTPTDCISAAYKLKLMVTRLPEAILEGRDVDSPEAVSHALLSVLLRALRSQLAVCARSVVLAARDAPMHGLLLCTLHVLDQLDTAAISRDESWSRLIEQIISTCVEVNAAVACVVNNSSPEGHLPMDMSEVVVTDHGNSGNVRLADGRPVTAQMVLLCAWRSVKEVSLVLGSISSRMSIQGEEQEYGTVSQQQMVQMGEHFTKLLAETKHRGAFEQAYVGFTKLLSRLWRCRSPPLHGLPRNWLRELMVTIATDDGTGVLCATRRSAGLPFMIQALVTTELQVSDKPKCFHECVNSLMRRWNQGGEGPHRAHCTNILRALVRCSALQPAVAPHVGDALLLALNGFDGTTWEERNSSTLLLSALMVRVFGVTRGRDAERLAARNRMTGRVFFLRYPRLYDFMLEKLNEVSDSEEARLLKPSLYPILLLLARLYPSALEGTVSNLKLSCFVGPVVSCARSSVLKTRQLAARALVPLISPNLYVSHIEEMLTLVCDKNIKRNFCHGILLQVIKLLDNKPDNLVLEHDAVARLTGTINTTKWILERDGGNLPCYLLMDEYLKMLNLIIWRFPSLINQDTIETIINHLDILLTDKHHTSNVHPGRDICRANATTLYIILINKYRHMDDIQTFIYKTLSHTTYEDVLSTLNYLLILHNNLEAEDRLQEHLDSIAKTNIIDYIRKDPLYTKTLYKVLKTTKYLECKQKCLKLLSLEDDTYRYIIQADVNVTSVTDDVILSKLTSLVETEHENLTHIYLYSLTTFITEKLKTYNVNGRYVLEAVRVLFACGSSENSDITREVVVGFLEKNFKMLTTYTLNDLNEGEEFEVRACLWASLVSVLEDEDELLRQRSARIATDMLTASTCPAVESGSEKESIGQGVRPAVGSRAAELVRAHVAAQSGGWRLLCVLSLLDFDCQLRLLDDADEECRIFGQSEKYNMFLEETVWAAACADTIKQTDGDLDACARLLSLLDEPTYKPTFDRLCGSNVAAFKSAVRGLGNPSNPKVNLFVRELKR